QELCELLAETPRLAAPLDVVRFDQDKGALACAYRRVQPLTDNRGGPSVRITYLHESIKRLLRDRMLFDDFGKFDLIYSAGLFDYLRAPTAVQLARDFYSRLEAGGQLIIANMVPENPSRWFMEHHLDWSLLYRTREALPFLWTTRGIFVALTIALLVLVSRPIFSRHPDFFSAGYVVAAASGISLMTTFLGGLSSPYYAGLSLVSVATGLIVVWRPQVVMVETALLLISFIIPNALLHRVGDASTAASNLMFLIGMTFVAALGQVVHYRSQKEMLASQVRLEDTKASLERAHNELKALDSF